MQAVILQSYTSISSTLDSLFHPYLPLEERIRLIGAKALPLTEEDNATLARGISLCRRWFFVPQGVKERMQNLPLAKVNEVVSGILADALEKDVSKKLKQFLQVLSEKQVQELSTLTTQEKIQIKLNIKAELKTDALKGFMSKRGKAFWQEMIPEFKSFLYYMLEMGVATTGVDELTPERHGRFSEGGGMSGVEAQMRLKVYLDFLLYPGVVFGIILGYVKNVPTALAATAALFTSAITFIGIYKRYYRPCPNECWGFENMNLKKTQTEEDPVYLRLRLLRKIDQAFQANKGALLVGDPGSGKTSIVQGYVQRVKEGKSAKLSRALQFFQGSGAGLKQYEGFGALQRKFAFWPKGVAFFINEFHSLFKENGIVGEQTDALKGFQDQYPFIIGDTTTKEFKEFIEENEPVKRRFMIIKVAQMVEQEVKDALYFYLHAKYPSLNIDSKVINEIYQQAPKFKPGTSIIDSATALLSRAIHKVTDLTFEDLQEKADDLEVELTSLKNKLMHEEPADGDLEKLIKLQKDLKDKNKEIEDGKIALAKIRRVEKVYIALKEKSYRLAPRALSKQEEGAQEKRAVIQGKDLREWLENEALLKQYDQFIHAERKKIGLASCLDVELIHRILEQAKEQNTELNAHGLDKAIEPIAKT